jgi:large subunit ribosomal protein L9
MATKKLLLKESIKNVGRVGDIVEVSPGYARNYLLPKDLAVEPTPGNIKKIELRKKEIEKQERERREQQAAMLKQLESVEVTLQRRANEQGHLFGSVTATDIAQGLQAQGFNINPDDINLPGRLDRIERYSVQVKFADDLATDIKVWVAPDAESKAAIDAAAKAKTAEEAAAVPPAGNFEKNA